MTFMDFLSNIFGAFTLSIIICLGFAYLAILSFLNYYVVVHIIVPFTNHNLFASIAFALLSAFLFYRFWAYSIKRILS